MKINNKNYFKAAVMCFILLAACMSESNDSLGDFGSGKGGSMARFAISGNYLYVVDNRSLIAFDITNPMQPIQQSKIELGFDIETIFPYEGHLLIGSQTGMHIVSIDVPANPEHISTYSHVTSCDPVVAKGNYAYVTLRTGSNCWGVNELHVLDISDVTNPRNVHVINMLNPHGLGVGQNNLLFVCEGEFGMKVFDITDQERPLLKFHFEGFHAYDVIPHLNYLIMSGNDGIAQYEYVNDSIEKISELLVVDNNE